MACSLFLSVLFFSVSEGFMPLPGRKPGRGAAETGSLMWHGGGSKGEEQKQEHERPRENHREKVDCSKAPRLFISFT